VRLFFACWPPRDVAAALHRWALQAGEVSGGRVTREEQIHLTLAFLGEMDEVPAIRPAGRCLRLSIQQARWWKHNRIVWVGPLETPEALVSLAASMKVETRPFEAHVTLIRKAREAALPPLEPLEWPIEEVLLVRSRLSARGSSYETLERFALT